MKKIFIQAFNVAKKLKLIIIINTIITLLALLVGYFLATSNISVISSIRNNFISLIAEIEPIKNIDTVMNQGKLWLAILITFGFNLGSAAFLTTTVTGIIFPYPTCVLSLRGILIGFLFAGFTTDWLVIILFLVTLVLEFAAYIISASAGANTGLALINPKRYNTNRHWKAFEYAWRDVFKIYPLVILLLVIGAIWEIGGIWLLR